MHEHVTVTSLYILKQTINFQSINKFILLNELTLVKMIDKMIFYAKKLIRHIFSFLQTFIYVNSLKLIENHKC